MKNPSEVQTNYKEIAKEIIKSYIAPEIRRVIDSSPRFYFVFVAVSVAAVVAAAAFRRA